MKHPTHRRRAGTVSSAPVWARVSALMCLFLALLVPLGAVRAQEGLEKAFRDALYAEEVQGDLEAALKAYQAVGAQFDKQRDMAAMALFRTAECLRKLGRKEEAVAAYQKLLTHYPDRERAAKNAREALAALGAAPAGTAPGAMPGGEVVPEAEAKEIERLKALVANSPDLLNAKVENTNSTPLERAAQQGQRAVVAYLLGQGARPTDFALDRAAEGGHKAICELLVDKSADPKAAATKALARAVTSGREAVVTMLLARGADPGTATGWVAFGSYTALEARLRVEEEGIREGWKASDVDGGPLLVSALLGEASAPVIQALLAAGAKPDEPAQVRYSWNNGKGPKPPEGTWPLTPLAAAIHARHIEGLRLLLAAKADVAQLGDDLGVPPLWTALALAEEKPAGGTGDVFVQALLAAGAKWDQKLPEGAAQGFTPAHLAAWRGLPGWLEAVLKAGVAAEAPAGHAAMSPLHFAAQAGSTACLKTLLAAGAKPDAAAKDAGTPLLLACSRWGQRTDRPADALDGLKALLDAGASPDGGLTKTGWAPLSACWQRYDPGDAWYEAVRLLLERGANPQLAEIHWRDTGNRGYPAGGAPPNPNEADNALFAEVWRAWIRHLPDRAKGVWFTAARRQFAERQPLQIQAVFAEGSASGPSTLRQFLAKQGGGPASAAEVTISRLKEGGEETVTAHTAALAAAPEGQRDVALQWGDVVEVDWNGSETSPELVAWHRDMGPVDVRLELPGGQRITNAENETGPVFRVAHGTSFAGLRRAAGLPPEVVLGENGVDKGEGRVIWLGEGSVNHASQWNGSYPVLHGSTIRLAAPAAEAKLSDEALRSGLWVCPSMDGPFTRVEMPKRALGPDAPALGWLLAKLMAPSPLLAAPCAWDKARIRRWKDGAWEEKPAAEAWQEVTCQQGLVFVLPPAEVPSAEVPSALRQALTEKLAFEWSLAPGDEPVIAGNRVAPRFFRAEKKGATWLWSPMEATQAGPIVPSMGDLLALHPGTSGLDVGNSAVKKDGIQYGYTITAWLSGGETVSVPKKAPPPQPGQAVNVNVPVPAGAVPGVPSRRVVLPTPGQ